MPDSDFIMLVQPVLQDVRVAQVQADQTAVPRFNLQPGEPVAARVLEQLPNGRFLTLVAGETLAMGLPPEVKTGDILRLNYLSNEPRLTFALHLPAGNPSGTLPVLSATVRWLASLSGTDGDLTAGSAVKAAPGGSPLTTGPITGADLAIRLQTALSRTGLFYEAHLSEWFRGERPLADLLEEPQGKLARQTGQLPAAPHAVQAGQNNTQLPLDRLLADSVPFPDSGESSDRNASLSPLPADPRTITLIREQLAALTSRQVVWEGDVWPQQRLKWAVEERDPEPGSREQERSWQTTLALDLPRLGAINARLLWQQDGITLVVGAEQKASVPVLRGAGDMLQKALAGAGIRVAALVIDHDETGR